MTLCSAIYEGEVRHRRVQPREHSFAFPLFMVYLDLSELESVFSMTRLWSAAHAAPARFRRADYLGGGALPLDRAVRDRVEAELGFRPGGPVRMLTHLRYFGCSFNPVTFYYCFDAPGERVLAIVAEITNTPWGERHAYVLDRRSAGEARGMMRWDFRKVFHVSPFMPMETDYDWSFCEPGPELFVHMNVRPVPGDSAACVSRPAKVFGATLQLRRFELTPARMRAQLVRFPFMTARVVARIHFEALRLWLKRTPVHPHPIAPVGAHGRPSAPAAQQGAAR